MVVNEIIWQVRRLLSWIPCGNGGHWPWWVTDCATLGLRPLPMVSPQPDIPVHYWNASGPILESSSSVPCLWPFHYVRRTPSLCRLRAGSRNVNLVKGDTGRSGRNINKNQPAGNGYTTYDQFSTYDEAHAVLVSSFLPSLFASLSSDPCQSHKSPPGIFPAEKSFLSNLLVVWLQYTTFLLWACWWGTLSFPIIPPPDILCYIKWLFLLSC